MHRLRRFFFASGFSNNRRFWERCPRNRNLMLEISSRMRDLLCRGLRIDSAIETYLTPRSHNSHSTAEAQGVDSIQLNGGKQQVRAEPRFCKPNLRAMARPARLHELTFLITSLCILSHIDNYFDTVIGL